MWTFYFTEVRITFQLSTIWQDGKKTTKNKTKQERNKIGEKIQNNKKKGKKERKTNQS